MGEKWEKLYNREDTVNRGSKVGSVETREERRVHCGQWLHKCNVEMNEKRWRAEEKGKTN